MNTSIVRRLIAKDLYLLRPIVIGALVIGGIGLAVMPLGDIALFVGWLTLFIVITLLGIFTTAIGVTTERKDRVHLLVLTLPVSPGQYLRAKIAASATAFFVPWTLLLVASLTLVAATDIPDGIMPFLAMLFCYIVCYYAAYLAMALVSDSVILGMVVVIVGNTAPIFLIQAFLRMSGFTAESVPAEAIWTTSVLAVIASEIAFSAGVLAIALTIRSRQRDQI